MFGCWPRRRQNFSDKVAGRENAPASMASRATSRAADGVALSTPVAYCTTLLRPANTGFPIYRRTFARHLPGSRSNVRTTKCLYSMCAPPEITMVSEYATGVSERFRQTGNIMALSRRLCSAGSSRHRTLPAAVRARTARLAPSPPRPRLRACRTRRGHAAGPAPRPFARRFPTSD